ncbi:hypothetical protein [Streptomyces sp. AGS-58]|uniref:hypothetical protein n=1 Tax=unclassified Streptomyces TaxID=2593676 RepID=UPI0035A271FD
MLADTAVDEGRWRHPVRFVRVRDGPGRRRPAPRTLAYQLMDAAGLQRARLTGLVLNSEVRGR